MSEFIFANIGAILGVVGGYLGQPWINALAGKLLGKVKAWILSKLA